MPRYFGRSQSVQRQTNGTSGSPASAAHKGRILIELSSLLGFKPPVGIRRVKRERGREQEMVWSHASLSDKAVLSACQVVTQLARADAQKVAHTHCTQDCMQQKKRRIWSQGGGVKRIFIHEHWNLNAPLFFKCLCCCRRRKRN